MVVANVHLDSNPERSDIRIEQLEQVKAEMELEMARCDDICGIVCGDFNFLPESEEEKTVPSNWKDCWTVNGMSKESEFDSTSSSSGWIETWLEQADVGYTSHYGRIDRVFFVTKKADQQALQVKKTTLLGVGVTVKTRNTFVPLSDHDDVYVEFSSQP